MKRRARMAYAMDFYFNKMDNGRILIIGENGVPLPAVNASVSVIARALPRDVSPILILMKFTSALRIPNLNVRIQAALDEPQKTVPPRIAHLPSVLPNRWRIEIAVVEDALSPSAALP